jgi:hypothetical protein
MIEGESEKPLELKEYKMVHFAHIKRLAALSLSFSVLHADTPRTYLSLGSAAHHNPTLPLTWKHEQGNISVNRYGGALEVYGLYNQTDSAGKLGNYFGMRDKDQTDFFNGISVAPANAQIIPKDIIHDAGVDDPNRDSLNQKLSFHPKQRIAGAHFVYFQQLSAISQHLALSIRMPILDVRTTMGIRTEESVTTERLRYTRDADPANPYTGPEVNLVDYLSGTVSNPSDPNQQLALQKMKIISGARSKAGLGDIDVSLHGLIKYTDAALIDIHFDFSIPTSNRPTGDFLFEAVYGNAAHWGVGGGIEAAVRVWQRNEETSLHLVGALRYTYLFAGTETRAVMYEQADGRIPLWELYRLGGASGQQALFPLANVLTQEVRVSPRGRFFGTALLAFQHRGFCFDTGYELYLQDKEKVHIKSWTNDTYNLANIDFNTANIFNPNADQHPDDGVPVAIQKDNLVPSTAATPHHVRHTLCANLGYTFNNWRQSLKISTGGGYEFASKTATTGSSARWMWWAQAGMLF